MATQGVQPVQAPARTKPAGPLARLRARGIEPEFGVSQFLAVLGVVVLIETAGIAADPSQRGPVGPRAIPALVGVVLLVLSVWHAIDVARGGHGEMEAGEDIELNAPADWKTVGVLVGGFVANIALIEPLGWPLSGAILFYVAAFALGSRSPLRDIAIALGLGFLSYYLFSNLLGIPLPTGVLEGVL